ASDFVDRDPVDDGALVALEPFDGVHGGVVLAVGDEDAASRQARLVSTSSTRLSALVSTSSTRFSALVSTSSTRFGVTRPEEPLQCQVDRLGATRREHHFDGAA